MKSQRNDAQQMLATMMVDPGFATDPDAVPTEAQARRVVAQVLAEGSTPRPRRQYRLWVADWTVYLRDGQDEIEVEVEEAFLFDELWRPGDPIKGPGMLVFQSQRAPDSTENQFRIEYTVAQFDPKAVAAVVSDNWRWKHVGEW